MSETVAAHRWLEDIYDPVVDAIPVGLRGRLAPPEIFHEILVHRWYLSEQAGHDVGTTAAARSYFETVLPHAPEPLTAAAAGPASRTRWPRRARRAAPGLRDPPGEHRPAVPRSSRGSAMITKTSTRCRAGSPS